MNSTQTSTQTQNSSTATSPFHQIQELEQRENTRVEKEISAMHKEKEEVSKAVATKEQQASEEMKTKAKKELKEYSESELANMLNNAKTEADAECDKLESAYKSKEDAAVQEILSVASNPDSLFLTA